MGFLGDAVAVARTAHEAASVVSGLDLRWDELCDGRKDLAVSMAVKVAMRRLLSPSELHGYWAVGMAGLGWSFGPEHNERDRAHPGILPWDSLSLRQQKAAEVFFVVARLLS